MAPGPQLAPPGSSSYSSDTMNVGDGTWDSQRNSFLLPNLVGLNFETMRYNGMGNRFVNLPGYHNLIRGHGAIAAITFLGIVPSAILIARFYGGRSDWARRLHIWLQVLTIALSTVVFILGWFAVGPKRSLTNPHHGIGLTIYIFILVQAIGGWWVYGREKGKVRRKISLKLTMHQWFGRTIALLGLAQVALGLTLYGSPRFLFVLYALVLFGLILTYFILSFRDTRSVIHGVHGSVVSGDEVFEERRSSRENRHGGALGTLAGVGAVGGGLAFLNRFRHRSRSRDRSRDRTTVTSSRRDSQSRVDIPADGRPSSGFDTLSEKHSRREHRGVSWRDRLLQIGTVGAAVALVNTLMNRRKDRDVDHGSDGRLGGRYSHSEESLSRVEAGASPRQGVHQPNRLHRRSQSYSSVASRTSFSGAGDSPGRSHKIRDTVATLGIFGLMRAAVKGRRERKEQKRIGAVRDRERENERLARQGSQRARFTGDGFPARGGRRGSLTTATSTEVSTNLTPLPRHDPGVPTQIAAGVIPAAGVGLLTGAALNDTGRGTAPAIYIPPTVNAAGNPIMPPMPANRQGMPSHSSPSGSEAYVSASGRQRRRHHTGRDAILAGAAGVAVGAAAAAASSPSRHSRRQYSSPSSPTSGPSTPPMAVKVKLHNDRNHNVTLRRLTEEERLAEKQAKRRDRQSRRNAPNDSEMSASDEPAATERWRRTEERERQEAEELRRNTEGNMNPNFVTGPAAGVLPPPSQPPNYRAENIVAPGTQFPPGYMPPPPPPPQQQLMSMTANPPRNAQHGSSPYLPPPPRPGTGYSGPVSVGSPGTVTEGSTSGDPSARRQRRRAERLQGGYGDGGAGAADVPGRGGYGVEFS